MLHVLPFGTVSSQLIAFFEKVVLVMVSLHSNRTETQTIPPSLVLEALSLYLTSTSYFTGLGHFTRSSLLM